MLGNIIKAKLAEKEKTHKECADLIGIDEQTLSNWINGRNTYYLSKFIDLICLLELDPCDLVNTKKDL